MEENYRLNAAQKAYLKTLVCQRIKDNKENEKIIKRFINMQNIGIAASLRNGGKADRKDKLAYYIVKDPELDMPLLFFSLKCGELAVPFVPERVDEILKNSEMLYAAATGHDAEDWAKKVVQNMKDSGKTPEEIEDEFRERYVRNVARQKLYRDETIVEGENIVRVSEVHPAVELVHFCAYDPINWRFYPHLTKAQKKLIKLQHDPVAKRWNAMGMDAQSLGMTMFWHFVVPVIQNIRKLVGCEYIYLFAADRIQYGDLVRYYERLGFEIRRDLSVSKPEYDFCCYFMCQNVRSLRNQRNDFFRDYNKTK